MFSSGKADPAFVSKGFRDWKHATGKTGILSVHSRCSTHRSATVAWEQFRLNQHRGSTIRQQVERVKHHVVEGNRHYIKSLAEIILLCAHEEIALRGHDENACSLRPGKFYALLDLIARHDPVVKTHLDELPRNAKYTSPQIQNNLLSIMGNITLEKICTEVREAQYFSLLVDETKDVSKVEQMSIVVRYALGGSIFERFLGYVAAKELNAQSLVGYITGFLQKVNISLKYCVCQCYDGASVMSGECAGVQARIKEIAPQATYVHCYAHRLNLVLVDCVKGTRVAQDFFALLEALYVFLSHSKANARFMAIQTVQRAGMQPRQLKRLLETRWACRHDCIQAVHATFQAVLCTLEAIADGDDNNQRITAKGLLIQARSFHFVLCLVMFDRLLAVTNALSKLLQAESLDLTTAVSLVTATEETFQDYRCDAKWDEIWGEAVVLAEENDIPVETPSRACGRRHAQPSNLQDGIVMCTTGSRLQLAEKDEFRIHLYFPVVDRMTNELNSRFSDFNKSLMMALFACSPKSKSFLDLSALKPILESYSIEEDDIQIELIQAKKVLKSHNLQSLSDVIDILQPLKAAFPKLLQVLQIAITFAVTTASCERSFSSLKRIKTYLRSTMGEQRLSNLALLSIERELSSTLSMEDVVDKFAIRTIVLLFSYTIKFNVRFCVSLQMFKINLELPSMHDVVLT